MSILSCFRSLARTCLVLSVLGPVGCGGDDAPSTGPGDEILPPAGCADYGALAVDLVEYDDAGYLGSAAVHGGYYYVASSNGLRSLRRGSGRTLEVASEIEMYALEVRVRGDHAYVITDEDLVTVDISTPNQIRVRSSVPLGVGLRELDLGERYAVVAGSFGISVVDLLIPSAPVRVGALTFPTVGVLDLAVEGDRVFVATDSGIRVISIADPARPSETGRYEAGRIFSVAALGNLVAFFGPSDVVGILDVVDPARPTLAGSWELVATPEGAVGISSGRVYLDTPAGLFVLGHAGGQNVKELGLIPHPVAIPGEIVLDGDELLLANGNLRVLETQEDVGPPDPVLVSTESFLRVVAEGDFVFAASDGIVAGFDLAEPDRPISLFEEALPAPATALAYADESLWIGTERGLLELRIDGSTATFGPSVDLGTRVDALGVRDGFLYVSRGSELIVLDSATDDFAIVGRADATWPGNRIEISGDVVFLYRDRWGFQAFDVTDRSAPTSIRARGFTPDPSGLSATANGNLLAVGLTAELRIVDPLGADSVQFLSATRLSSDIRDLVFEDNLLYVSTTHRIEVLEVVDGTAPIRLAAWPLRGSRTAPTKVVASGSHLILWTPQGLELLPAQCANGWAIAGRTTAESSTRTPRAGRR